LLLRAPELLHDVNSHGAFRGAPVVSPAQESQIRRIMRSAIGKRPDVVDLNAFLALTPRSIRGNERALSTVTHEDLVSCLVR
jgi:hypothetical protein